MNVIKNFPLNKITTLGIGGSAKEFVVVKTEAQLKEVLEYAKEHYLHYYIVGGGSNLLVSDKGVDFLVIKNEITGINVIPAQAGIQKVIVKSGTPLQELVDFTIAHGLSGLQKMTGIPGTVGGAIYGNAGAYGQTISDNITNVVVLNSFQDLQTLSKDECGFSYRDSIFKKTKQIILEITFNLEKGSPEELAKEAKDILSQRLIKYPTDIKCPGSFFKNIPAETLSMKIVSKLPKDKIPFGKINAGYLLEAVGAKGDKLGNIEIAPYHANLFINKGGGTAKDFYNLAKKYAKLVKEKFGISLEPEVQLVNLPPI